MPHIEIFFYVSEDLKNWPIITKGNVRANRWYKISNGDMPSLDTRYLTAHKYIALQTIATIAMKDANTTSIISKEFK